MINFNWSKIEELVQQGYINKNIHPETGYFLYNYTAKTQYEAYWTPETEVCRGLIVDQDRNIIALPFQKIFNWMEGGRRSALSGHIVTVTEKLDGSLACLYRIEDQYALASRGSFSSPHALWATKYLCQNFNLLDLPKELTLIFEGIAPQFRIILDYQGREDLVLLAARNRFTGEYLPFYPDLYNLAAQYGFSLPKTYTFNKVTDIIERMNYLPETEEGYVVEFSDGSRFKFKGDRYLELHKLICGLTFRKILIAHENNTISQVYQLLPEEFHGQVSKWVEDIDCTINFTESIVSILYRLAPNKISRKEFALWVQKNAKKFAPYLFNMLDGKPVEPLIYKYILQNHKEEVIIEDEF